MDSSFMTGRFLGQFGPRVGMAGFCLGHGPYLDCYGVIRAIFCRQPVALFWPNWALSVVRHQGQWSGIGMRAG